MKQARYYTLRSYPHSAAVPLGTAKEHKVWVRSDSRNSHS